MVANEGGDFGRCGGVEPHPFAYRSRDPFARYRVVLTRSLADIVQQRADPESVQVTGFRRNEAGELVRGDRSTYLGHGYEQMPVHRVAVVEVVLRATSDARPLGHQDGPRSYVVHQFQRVGNLGSGESIQEL